MSVVPCLRSPEFEKKAAEIADALKQRAHEFASAGLSEEDFYDQGYFRAAIEKIRGQYAATMREKREFMRAVLSHLQDNSVVTDWSHAENRDRHDYAVSLAGGGTAVIEQKGCLDGNNVNISERPPHADEFYIWSLCTNQGSDLEKGIRSALMRITADMIATEKRVDGLIVWDMMCGQSGRPCPKMIGDPTLFTDVKQYRLPPPCIYLFPATVGHARVNPKPPVRSLDSLKFAKALIDNFKGKSSDVHLIEYELRSAGTSTQRRVQVTRDGVVLNDPRWAQLKRIKG